VEGKDKPTHVKIVKMAKKQDRNRISKKENSQKRVICVK
jgi:hypothetical protein